MVNFYGEWLPSFEGFTARRWVAPMGFLFVVFLLLYPGCGDLQRNGEGDLTGLVLDSLGKPINGAKVTIGSNPNLFDTTNKQGQFKFLNLEAKDTPLVATREGYQESRVVVTVKKDQQSRYDLTLVTTQKISVVTVYPYSASAIFYWTTANNTRTNLKYGLNNNLTEQLQDFTFSRDHTLTLPNLSPATSYFYQVEAVSAEGNIERSDIANFTTQRGQAIEIPKNPVLFDISRENRASIGWDTPVSTDIIGYNIYRSSSRGSGFTRLNSDPVRTTSYEDKTLSAGQNYVWFIKSINSENLESEPSEYLSMIAPGTLSGRITLNKENNPHYLRGDVVINAGSSLTIGPGVEILVGAADEFFTGDDTSKVELDVRGSLQAVGSPLDFITIKIDPEVNANPSAGSWVGIDFETGSDAISSSLYFAKIFHAGTGVGGTDSSVKTVGTHFFNCNTGVHFNGATNVLISSCTIDLCPTAINVESALSFGAGNLIEKNLITRCAIGVNSNNNENILIKENTFRTVTSVGAVLGGTNNTNFQFNLMDGLSEFGITINGAVVVKNNTLEAKTGIAITSGSPDIYNNILIYNQTLGIALNTQQAVINASTNTGIPVIDSNIIDPTFSRTGVNPAINFIEDPLLDANFVPTSTSPALDNKGRNGENIGRYI